MIGVAVEADIDYRSGEILEFSGMSFMNKFNIVEYMENKYKVKSSVYKLLNVEALACMNELAIKDYIYVHIGAGIGAAIVIDGKVYQGANGKAGELVRVKSPSGLSWEQENNTTILYRKIISTANKNPTSRLSSILMEEISIPHGNHDKALMLVIERALEEGIEEVVTEVNKAAEGWANIIYTLHIFFDPAAIIVGGDITYRTPNIFGIVKNAVEQKCGQEKINLFVNNKDTSSRAVAVNMLDQVFNSLYEQLMP